jgi:hypothetical protein
MLAMVVQGCGGDDNGMEVEVPPPDDDDGVDPVTELEEVKKERDKYKKMLEDMEAEEAAMMASAKASAIFDALDMNTGTAPAVTAKAGADGMLTFEAMGYEMGDYADMIDGWRGKMLAGDEAEMVVYTDIENAMATPISRVYNGTLMGGVNMYTVSNEGRDDVPDNTIGWADVTLPTGTVTRDPKTDAADDDVHTIAGMVGDVPGTFSCTGAADGCAAPTRDMEDGSISFDNGGEVEGNPATWTFTPTDPNVMVDVADSDGYLVFGWWLGLDDDGAPEEFDAFAMAQGMTLIPGTTQGTALDGTAKYEGAAAGKFAMKSLHEDTVTGGHWTANASLTANFDANTADADVAADTNGVMISGMIDDFMTGDTARDWTVTLMAVDTNVDAVGDPAGSPGIQSPSTLAEYTAGDAANPVASWDFGGSVDGMGNWSAAFHGPTATDEPTAITGEFNAMVDGFAQINGAFGANMMMEDAAMMAGN